MLDAKDMSLEEVESNLGLTEEESNSKVAWVFDFIIDLIIAMIKA